MKPCQFNCAFDYLGFSVRIKPKFIVSDPLLDQESIKLLGDNFGIVIIDGSCIVLYAGGLRYSGFGALHYIAEKNADWLKTPYLNDDNALCSSFVYSEWRHENHQLVLYGSPSRLGLSTPPHIQIIRLGGSDSSELFMASRRELLELLERYISWTWDHLVNVTMSGYEKGYGRFINFNDFTLNNVGLDGKIKDPNALVIEAINFIERHYLVEREDES